MADILGDEQKGIRKVLFLPFLLHRPSLFNVSASLSLFHSNSRSIRPRARYNLLFQHIQADSSSLRLPLCPSVPLLPSRSSSSSCYYDSFFLAAGFTCNPPPSPSVLSRRISGPLQSATLLCRYPLLLGRRTRNVPHSRTSYCRIRNSCRDIPMFPIIHLVRWEISNGSKLDYTLNLIQQQHLFSPVVVYFLYT